MSSVQSCYHDISVYNAMRVNLISVANHLNAAASKLAPVGNNVYSVYHIDENKTPISQRSDKLVDDIRGTSQYISNVLLPAIDASIRNKKNEAQYLESVERSRMSR